MAVDVSGYAEVYSDRQWRFFGQLIPPPEREYDPDQPEMMPEKLFHSTLKRVAAVLIKAGNPSPSSEPSSPAVPRRGLPPDLSPELSSWLRPLEGELGFETNWFTASEVSAFGWGTGIVRRRAFVRPEAAPLFADCPIGFPFAKWPAGIPISYADWSKDWVEVEWLETESEDVARLLHPLLPNLTSIAEPDHVRFIVTASW
ncbi:Uncharacterized protein OS=Ktedonobacter racemifer DSM 44963 GN=Krac_5288 PE=4 SV=1 [Tuwongella immobilis]|uniref:Uncharacterized protein n=1 Tax=Tuwongella immobilis TaxID=692036 RepID=A0A6C2YVE5_9BACT|nr:Uncharacterized protein OS=Ktedonobacter racemifer DSM 44963 GN=Krac_5288 PE=4 SV=1 [Tuwongella immobilis]VTS07642.1 Uncharacterized protein OS=Ktedonobacter racemifer DSM 44963 GN=Krac_5288 PE=4 SV=1 [Tuwongella immobilis]